MVSPSSRAATTRPLNLKSMNEVSYKRDNIIMIMFLHI